MKSFVFVLVASVLALACAGCGSTPQHRLRSAYDSYASTLGVLSDLREADSLSDSQAGAIETWRQVARTCLDEWKIALDCDEPTERLERQFRAAMGAIEDMIMAFAREASDGSGAPAADAADNS